SPLLGSGRLALRFRFPYGTGATTAADWTRPDAHSTVLVGDGPRRAQLERRLDGDAYTVDVAWTGKSRLREAAAHDFVLTPSAGERTLSAVLTFAPRADEAAPPSFEDV